MVLQPSLNIYLFSLNFSISQSFCLCLLICYFSLSISLSVCLYQSVLQWPPDMYLTHKTPITKRGNTWFLKWKLIAL